MRRRKNDPLLVDLVHFASIIPWYVNSILIVLSYVFFRYLSRLPALPSAGIQDLGGTVARQIIVAASGYLQYLIPICLVIGLVLSLFKTKYRRQLIEAQTDIESIRNLSWQDFEKLVSEAFRLKGYIVTEVGGGGPDEGIDLVLSKDGQKTLVQCKNWRRDSVGVSVVRELFGVMAAHKVPYGIIVCSGTYTNDALAFVDTAPIELIDGQQLLDMVREVQPITKRVQIESTASFQGCPACGSRMVPRIAQRGANMGNSFLGCVRYPQCKGTRPV